MLSYQIETGFFKWEVIYTRCGKEDKLYVWADNHEEAIEKAVEELIKKNKATDCKILTAHKVDISEDI